VVELPPKPVLSVTSARWRAVELSGAIELASAPARPAVELSDSAWFGR